MNQQPAWIVRSFERRRIVEAAITEIMSLEGGCDDPRAFQRKLIKLCFGFLAGEVAKEAEMDYADSAEEWFFQNLLPEIEGFSRVGEEIKPLIRDVHNWLVKSFMAKFDSELSSKEISDPKTVFKAPSATDCIDFDPNLDDG